LSDLYRTSEVRWFFSGEVPPAITEWFLQTLPGGSQGAALKRQDVYLLVPGRDDVGLKFRRDKIQLKLRRNRRPFSALGGRVLGVQTDWERHSWTYDQTAEDLARAFSGKAGLGHQVAVAKTRRQKTYGLGPEGDPQPLAAGKRVKTPALVELTEIAFVGFLGWSLGLEIVGPHSPAQGHLLPAVAGLLRDFPALPLKQCDSLDYPEFIWRQVHPADHAG
jgi:hypothetical protein